MFIMHDSHAGVCSSVAVQVNRSAQKEGSMPPGNGFDNQRVPNLQDRLDEFKRMLESGDPSYNVLREAIEKMHQATGELKASGIEDRTLKVGDRGPSFTLFRSGSRAGGFDRSSPRKPVGHQLLPGTLVRVLHRGAGSSTSNRFRG